ncbi:MAG: ABC transporter substrate-binding protein [Rhodospirillales bacterium]|nr:ABC transporter substrate-binding protein [Rhodospirillales bacterium]
MPDQRPQKPQQTPITAGFMPLLDAALLIVAHEKGFCESRGIALKLVRETSWATLRDRMTVGHFDVAHMLAPMPIAAALGSGPMYAPMIVPMALGLGGNAVTVSNALFHEMCDYGAVDSGDAKLNGLALAKALAGRAAAGRKKSTIGIVHRFSSHNFELRYWLQASGIVPDRDIDLTVVPPPFMADALAAGHIDGFCVGEPWNSVAVERGVGNIVTTKSSIWRSSPDKVLAVGQQWAEQNRQALAALMQALVEAAIWCGNGANIEQLASILSAPGYLDQPAAILRRGLSGEMPFRRGGPIQKVPDFLIYDGRAATFPWVSHALWYYTQMVRWKLFTHSNKAIAAARQCYRPDIYRAALAGSGIAIPSVSMKVEGALSEPTIVSDGEFRLTLGPDGFFDGQKFDPDLIEDYIFAHK